MDLRKIRHLVVHTPRHLLARTMRWLARSGWEYLLRRRAQLLRNIGIGVVLLACLIALIVLIINVNGGQPPATSSTATVPASSASDPTAAPTPEAGPGPASGPPVLPPADPEVAGYMVARGDTLATIALHWGVPFEQLAADNGIADPNQITSGRRLRIKAPAAGVVTIRPGATLSSYAAQAGTSVATLVTLNPQIADPDHIVAGGALRLHTEARR